MDLIEPDILLLRFLSRYTIADIECAKTIYETYGHKRYYNERLAKLKSNKNIAVRNMQSHFALLKNGKDFLEQMGYNSAYWYTGSKNNIRRLESVSKTAALLMKAGINVLADYPLAVTDTPAFIPSSIIKANVLGIDRQSRFAGTLFMDSSSFAVYDLGDGSRMWQPLSEYSLFKDGLRDNWQLSGMLFFADENSLLDISSSVIIADLSPGKISPNKKRIENPLRLWPGYRKCNICCKSDAVFMLGLLKTKEWKAIFINDLFSQAETIIKQGGNIVDPDCYYLNNAIYLMLDNDLLRAHLLRNYLNIYPVYEEQPLHIYCHEKYSEMYIKLFPELRIVPVRNAVIERMLELKSKNI